MKYWLGLSLLSTLAGCGNVTQSELVGTWEADYPVAKEKLTLLADGTFVQQVTLKADSRMLEAKGVWRFSEADQDKIFDQDIILEDTFLNVLDGFGEPRKPPVPGTAIKPVLRWFGNVQIGDNPYIVYKKQRTRPGAP